MHDASTIGNNKTVKFKLKISTSVASYLFDSSHQPNLKGNL